MSGTHYWVVDGLWPEGTVLEGRVYYQGENDSQFDFDLLNGDETGMVLLYRPTANDVWSICPDQTITAGSLTNGNGLIKINNMQKGQYTFAKAEAIIGVEEASDTPFSMNLGPIPASDVIRVSGHFDGGTTMWWDVVGSDGRLAQLSPFAAAG